MLYFACVFMNTSVLPCVCAICPSVCECEVESVHISGSVHACVCVCVCVCVSEREKKSLRPVYMCKWMRVAVTVCVHRFVYVWVWRAVLAYTDLCQEEDVFLNKYSAFCSLDSAQINLHTVKSPHYSTLDYYLEGNELRYAWLYCVSHLCKKRWNYWWIFFWYMKTCMCILFVLLCYNQSISVACTIDSLLCSSQLNWASELVGVLIHKETNICLQSWCRPK